MDPRFAHAVRLAVFLISSGLSVAVATPGGPDLFGPYFSHPTTGRPTGFASLPPRGTIQELGILTASPSAFVVLRQKGGDTVAVSRVFPLTGQYHLPIVLHASPPRTLEMVALTPDGSAVAFIKAGKGGTLEEHKPLEGYADRIAVADVDGDRQREILAFGKRMAGIAVFRRVATGDYEYGTTLVPEISASDASIADANGDGMNDVVILDWLNNRMSIYFSSGAAPYTEPSEYRLPSEPGSLSFTRIPRFLLLAVTLPQQKEIVVLSCDLSGRIELGTSLSLPWEPGELVLRDINRDGRADIVCAGGDAISVALGRGGGKFANPVSYHGPAEEAPWLLQDLDGDARADLVFSDTKRREVCIALHALPPGHPKTILRYLVGKNPTGIVIDDINGDGRNDIVAANAGSGALSVLMGLGAAGFDAQRSISVSDDPCLVTPVGGPSELPRKFVVAHPRTEQFTYLVTTRDLSDQQAVSFPSGLDARVLSSSTDAATGWSRFLGRYRNRKGHGFSVSVFEQVSERAFVERGLSDRLPAMVLATTGNAGPDSTGALFVASYERGDRLCKVIEISLSGSGARKPDRVLATIPDSLGRIRWMVARDLDRDGLTDLVFGTDRFASQLAILYGAPDTGVSAPAVWVHSPSPLDDQWVLIHDFDHDGQDDLVLPEADRQSLTLSRGGASRTFAPPEPLCATPDMSAFAAGALLGSSDVAFTSARRGTVSIVVEPYRRRK